MMNLWGRIRAGRAGARFAAAIVIGLSGSLAGGMAVAAEGAALAAEKGCTACHDMKARRVGPAFTLIAKRYTAKDRPKLVQRVLKGGAGSWGNIPMPNNLDLGVTKADADNLVLWILKQK